MINIDLCVFIWDHTAVGGVGNIEELGRTETSVYISVCFNWNMQTFFFNYKNYDKVPEEIDVREERFALTLFSLWRRERETIREKGERIHKHSKRKVQDKIYPSKINSQSLTLPMRAPCNTISSLSNSSFKFCIQFNEPWKIVTLKLSLQQTFVFIFKSQLLMYTTQNVL